MRPRVLIPTMIVLLAALTILLWRPPTPKAVSSDIVQQSVQSSNMPIAATNAAGSMAVTSAKSNVELPTNLPIPSDATLSPETIRKGMESLNVPIQFYGKIIDQDGNPLADAEVQGRVLHLKVIAPIPGGDQDEIIPIDRKSDSDGRFEIQGMTGRGISIESIQKNGYEVEPTTRSHDSTEGSLNGPVVFKMWSTNIHEQLISGDKKFQIVPDGRPYFINLTDGTIAESGTGDLKVLVKRPDQITYGKRYDWSCEIDVVNGGLLQGDSYSMLSAPAEGYVPSFNFEQKVGSGWGDSTGEKKFYVMLNNGKEYGRISIELYAYYNNQMPGMIRLSYAINPSGSRVLR